MDYAKWSNERDREQRRNRSRSPLEKNNKSNRSRDSSTNRNSRELRNNRSRSPIGRRTRAPTNRRIYVANIPYDCKWTTVKDLFREKVGDVPYVELFNDENGKFRGCGILEFKEASSVQKAVELLHRFEFKGRQLVVKEDFDVDRDKTGKPLGRSRGGGNSNGGGGDFDNDRNDYGGLENTGTPEYDTYGLSPQFLDSLGITGPLGKTIFVANLDYKVVTPQKLEEVFKLAGHVVKVNLKIDEEGNSKGHGTITMGHPVEAVQAISMFNGKKFYNRTMSVRMDKKHNEDPEEKPLPEGLQGVGKGLGANGLPLHLSSNSGGVNSLGPTGLAPVGGVAGNFGLMSNQMTPGVVGASSTGIPGLAGIGMGIQERNFSALGTNVGVGQNLCFGIAGNAGLGNHSLLPGSLGVMSSTPGGFGTSGLGGTGLSLGTNAASAVLGYSDYNRSFDHAEDGYHTQINSDTIIVRNLPMSYTWQNLRDRFRIYGDIRFSEMKGRGTAIIRFTSPREAQVAVDHQQGARIDGRLIDVSLY